MSKQHKQLLPGASPRGLAGQRIPGVESRLEAGRVQAGPRIEGNEGESKWDVRTEWKTTREPKPGGRGEPLILCGALNEAGFKGVL